MFTSRAEYRLLLREDNAADRLMPIGRELGLVSDDAWSRYEFFADELQQGMEYLASESVLGKDAVNEVMKKIGNAPIKDRRITFAELLKRPEIQFKEIEMIASAFGTKVPAFSAAATERMETEIKYSGYLERQEVEAKRLSRYEDWVLPRDTDYQSINGLSFEDKEKLSAVKPHSIGQASRISGVTPVAITILMTYLSALKKGQPLGSQRSSTL
jgi:tRNA uridine 5-carboxymethylaminomethyl modification enzyme